MPSALPTLQYALTAQAELARRVSRCQPQRSGFGLGFTLTRPARTSAMNRRHLRREFRVDPRHFANIDLL